MVKIGDVIYVRQWRSRGPVNFFRARVTSEIWGRVGAFFVECEPIDHDGSGAEPTGRAYWNEKEKVPCWDDGHY